MPDVFVGLGSNVGDPAANLREALERLARRVDVVDVSSAYWTEPVGLRDQPDFLNAVVRVRTEMSALETLEVLKEIEAAMGRRREVPLGPRTIDLDLLLYDDLEVDGPELVLPHPRMEGRRFVLVPLAEIAPGVRLRVGGPTADDLLALLPAAEAVERAPLERWPPPLLG